MLRLIISIALALFVVLSGAAAGLRWIGHQQTEGQFPLPSTRGCWEDICFFARANVDVLPSVLLENPRIASVNSRPDVTHGDYNEIEFIYTPAGGNPKSVVLYWSPYSYSLVRDATYATNPPLMTLADLLLSLGPPDQVSLADTQGSVILHYSQRGFSVSILPKEFGLSGIRLRPSDPVIAILATPSELDTATTYYPPSWDWHGFGLYLQ
jgi:hypothetical protein